MTQAGTSRADGNRTVTSLFQTRRLTIYAFAVAVSLATLWLRIHVDLGFGHRPLLIIFMFPIILSALVGGLGPGLAATLVCVLGVNIAVIPPVGRFKMLDLPDLLPWVMLIINGVLISGLSEALHRSRHQAEARREQQSAEMTSRLQAENALRESEARFRLLVESTHIVAWEMPLPPRTFSYVSPYAEHLLGYPLARWYEPDFWAEHVHPDDRDYAVGACYGSTARGEDHESEYRMLGLGGRIVWVREIASLVRKEDGAPACLRGVLIDVTESQLAEEKLRQAAAVFENAQEGILITDPDTRILAVNRAFCEITGYAEWEVLGETPAAFKSGRHDADFYKAMWEALARTGRWQGEVWDRRRDGEVFPKWLSISAVPDAGGHVGRYVAIFADITHLKKSEARLEHLAHFDPLTDLPNRLLFNLRLAHALEQTKRHGRRIAVLFLDLDRFKTVNDSLGHPAGDELLIAMARRLRARLRDEDTLARLGGDEFVILLEQLDEAQQAAVVAEELLRVVSAPVQLAGGHEVFIGGSIGISLYPDDAGEAMQLVRNADAALYQAKEHGRNTYRFYTESLTRDAQERLAMEAKLRRALERREFVLHYQPQVAVADGRVIGVEALIRWQHPEEGLVAPAHFIPLAEETGLIVELGEWVLDAACARMREWLDSGRTPITLAVNLSSRQFRQGDLAERVRTVLDRSGLPAGLLELEITESAIMEQGDQAVASVRALKALGVRLAIDDFGTGYSSLAYLKRFAVDTLKIDRSFVRDIPDDQNDKEIAASIIGLARNLRLKVLAEGVESEAQLAFLRANGCDAYQGFLFSQPLAAEELEATGYWR